MTLKIQFWNVFRRFKGWLDIRKIVLYLLTLRVWFKARFSFERLCNFNVFQIFKNVNALLLPRNPVLLLPRLLNLLRTCVHIRLIILLNSSFGNSGTLILFRLNHYHIRGRVLVWHFIRKNIKIVSIIGFV